MFRFSKGIPPVDHRIIGTREAAVSAAKGAVLAPMFLTTTLAKARGRNSLSSDG
jgi:hypothetical protein